MCAQMCAPKSSKEAWQKAQAQPIRTYVHTHKMGGLAGSTSSTHTYVHPCMCDIYKHPATYPYVLMLLLLLRCARKAWHEGTSSLRYQRQLPAHSSLCRDMPMHVQSCGQASPVPRTRLQTPARASTMGAYRHTYGYRRWYVAGSNDNSHPLVAGSE